ncbi:MAG: efflux RND transporter periplasmic adaptor subunit [Planctomycetes bacterium]|nr:efflux RND transporter periplasmic adaptor subunit [Planctomycetota bacterium]
MNMKFTMALALPILLAACGPGGPPEVSDAKQARNVVVRLVKPQPIEVKISLPVVIRPHEEVELRAAAPGVIRTLAYDEGDTIPETRVPARTWLEAADFLAAQPEGVAPTQEQLVFRNLRHLEGFASFARIDDSQLLQGFREAQESYDQAVRDLKRTEEYPQSTGAQLDAARTRRSMARAAVERVLAMIEDTYVCNPARGVLTERLRREGEYVNGGELIGRVAVMDRLVAELEIPEAHRQMMQPGVKLGVTLASLTDGQGSALVREATVSRVDYVAHPITHSFTVELELPNGDMSLPAGIFGTVHVVIYRKPDALVVPLSAVRLSGTMKSLFVLPASGGSRVQELADVRLGNMTSQWVEVLGNRLKPGMRVVTFGAQMLADGDEVQWTEQDPYVAAEESSP